MAAINGALYGLLPIGWIVLNAIFIYDITVKSGDFEVVKHSIAGLASDRRIQALLIAFSFGAFIEGAAGFGTPVAISAAMLIGLGFRPSRPPDWRSSAIPRPWPSAPWAAPHRPGRRDRPAPGGPQRRRRPHPADLLPHRALLDHLDHGWAQGNARSLAGLPHRRGSFAVMQFLTSNYHGPWLVDIIGAIVSMVALIILLKFWQPKTTWRYEHEREEEQEAHLSHARNKVFRAWMPWVLMSVFVFAWARRR